MTNDPSSPVAGDDTTAQPTVLTPADRQAAITTLLRALAQAREQARERVLDTHTETRSTQWEYKHGVVQVQGGKTSASFDDDAFLAWVREHHPQQIHQVVNPAFRQKMLQRARVVQRDNGEQVVVDGNTGEVLPFAHPAVSPRTVKVVTRRDATVEEDAATALTNDDTLRNILAQLGVDV